MDESHVYIRALNSAAARAGGIDQLAGRLELPAAQIRDWIEGHGKPDIPMLLRIVAIALDLDPR